jgi:hypothetical protein
MTCVAGYGFKTFLKSFKEKVLCQSVKFVSKKKLFLLLSRPDMWSLKCRFLWNLLALTKSLTVFYFHFLSSITELSIKFKLPIVFYVITFLNKDIQG